MDEDQLRGLIRDVMARHLTVALPPVEPPWKQHASHLRLSVFTDKEGDGPCIIEPAVACNHCRFCQSMGH